MSNGIKVVSNLGTGLEYIHRARDCLEKVLLGRYSDKDKAVRKLRPILPYRINVGEDVGVVNRDYKPLGVTSKDWVDYADYPQYLIPRSACLLKNTEWLFDDGCPPWADQNSAEIYLSVLDDVFDFPLDDENNEGNPMEAIKKYKDYSPLEVSNDQFLQEMYAGHDGHLLVCSFVGDPKPPPGEQKPSWEAVPYDPGSTIWNPTANNYGVLSTYTGLARVQPGHCAMYLVMVDDIIVQTEHVGGKVSPRRVKLLPTSLIETSPGNAQALYRLAEPITDEVVATRLIAALIEKLKPDDGTDPGMAGSNRYYKLPEGRNGKPKANGWDNRVLDYDPSRVYSLWEICETYSIDIKAVLEGPEIAPVDLTQYPDGGPVVGALEWLNKRRMVQAEKPDGRYIITCPWADEHTDGDDSGTCIGRPGTHGTIPGFWFKCHHGHCKDRRLKDFMSWARSEGFSEAGSAMDDFEVIEGETHPLAQYRDAIPEVPDDDDMLIEGVISAKVSFLGAYAGAGKTTAMVPLVAIVTGLVQIPGLNILGWRRVVYISEHPEQFELSLKALARHYEIPPADITDRVKVVTAKRMSVESIVKAVPHYKHLAVSHTHADVTVDFAPWVVIDTQAATLHMESENDTAEASKSMAVIKTHFDGVPVTLVAHTAKAHKRGDVDAMTIRGAGSFEADSNQVMLLSYEKDSNQRFIEIGIPKHRFTATVDALAVHFHKTDLRVRDRFKRTITRSVGFCTLEPVTAAEKAEIKEKAKQDAQAVVNNRKLQQVLDIAVEAIEETGAKKELMTRTKLKAVVQSKGVQGLTNQSETVGRISELISCGALVESTDIQALRDDGWEVKPNQKTNLTVGRAWLDDDFDIEEEDPFC